MKFWGRVCGTAIYSFGMTLPLVLCRYAEGRSYSFGEYVLTSIIMIPLAMLILVGFEVWRKKKQGANS